MAKKGRAFHRSAGRPLSKPVLRQPDGKTAPWYLKAWGSKPKKAQPIAEVA